MVFGQTGWLVSWIGANYGTQGVGFAVHLVFGNGGTGGEGLVVGGWGEC